MFADGGRNLPYRCCVAALLSGCCCSSVGFDRPTPPTLMIASFAVGYMIENGILVDLWRAARRQRSVVGLGAPARDRRPARSAVAARDHRRDASA